MQTSSFSSIIALLDEPEIFFCCLQLSNTSQMSSSCSALAWLAKYVLMGV